MEAVVQEPITKIGTISEEKWNSLHTLEELDATLKTIIHKHFHRSGLERAMEDVRAGRVYRANSVEDLMAQLDA